MGEIKSTLDLVMEKTKNLTLSVAEKQAQKQKETESRLKGLMQKFQDGLLAPNQLKTDYENLKKDFDLADDTAMINEIFSRLDPLRDNQPLLEILKACGRLNADTVRTLIDEWRNGYLKAAQERRAQLKEKLARKYAIAGTAVVPNLEADAQWGRIEKELRLQFEEKLAHVTGKRIIR